ncbi:hypothetical protein ACO0K9_07465 [Undibacterium sp. Ji50W]|uniref:hypothetical protein n=1 Tax=Undibacterium sp. Ji50W TaxID=3413041 RepID=UPI003BF382A6
MITAEDAQTIILRLCHQGREANEFVIQSCVLSPRNDYWVVRANSADYVLRGMEERCYVGVSAHLVDVFTGEVETVGSGQGWQSYLVDKYDLINAKGNHYILSPAFDKRDKSALINLRQKLECRLQDVIYMTSPDNNFWLAGRLSALCEIKKTLEKANIKVNIELHSDLRGAVEIDNGTRYFDVVKKHLQNRICRILK